jgi:hypothetical protein
MLALEFDAFAAYFPFACHRSQLTEQLELTCSDARPVRVNV